MRFRSTLVKVLVILVLPLTGASVAIAVSRAHRGIPDGVAFEVAGRTVTTADLDHQAGLLQALYGIKQPSAAPDQDTYRRDLAKAVAVAMVLDRAAADAGVVIPDKAARDTLSAMVDKQLGSNGQRQFTALLGDFGVTEDDVLTEIKRQQSIARLFRTVTTPAVDGVSDTEVQQLFDEDPARFAAPEQRTLGNIVVSTRQEAARLRARLAHGADFATLARTTSLDDATRDRGGSLGSVTAEQLDAAYARAAFAAPEHGFFGPVRTQYGWNVGEVVAIQRSTRPSFADVKADVRDALRSQRALEAWRSWLVARVQDAHIEYAAAYRPSDPDALPPGLQDPAQGAP